MASHYGEVLSGAGVSLTLPSGDTAYYTIVRNRAVLRVNYGAYVENTTVYNSATFSNGGTASATFLSGGTMTLLSGGTARSVDVLRNARLTVSSGAVATGLYVSSGNVNTTVRGGDYITWIDGTNEVGSFYLYHGVAFNFLLNSTGVLTILDGGTAQYTTIRNNGMLTVSNGGVATDINQNTGGKLNTTVRGGDNQTYVAGSNVSGTFLLANGVASGFILYENTAQHVSNGGIALNTLVSTSWAHQFVYSGGTASATTLYRLGSMTVYDGGVASDTVVSSGGSMMPIGGEVRGATIYGELLVTSGASGEEESGGIATLRDVTIASGGIMKVTQHANFGDELTVAGKAEVSATMTMLDGATMTMLDGASLVLDISARSGATTAILSDWTKVVAVGGATYSLSLTVGAVQACGAYKLIGNAETFDRTIPVKSGKTELGTLVRGGQFITGDSLYTLTGDGAENLVLSIAVNRMNYIDDLNGDRRADIMMSITQSGHPDYGATGAWLIQADQTAAWGDLSQRGDGWELFGTGFTTAGKATADIYIKSADNVVGAWITDATGKVTGWETVGEFDASTQVLGLGDFNGDGQTDLLLRNNNGAVGGYFTNGTGWQYFQSLGNEWTIAAIGDLNGDGISDMVLKHDAGFAGSWLTQADGTMKWANLDTLKEGFAIVGCGDLNGDGTDDVLLRNDGYYGAWIVKNGSVNSWMGLGDLGSVTVEQLADFDGDGIDDLRIRTAGGDLGAMLVKGEDNLDWKYYGSVGPEWSTSLATI